MAGHRDGYVFEKPVLITIVYRKGNPNEDAEAAPNLRLFSHGSWISARDTCLEPWSSYDPVTRVFQVRFHSHSQNRTHTHTHTHVHPHTTSVVL